MHLGPEAYLSSDKHATRLEWGNDICINPGENGLLITEETVNLPQDLAAFISLRLSIAIRGLVNISGRHVDPGYSGKLVFSVYNAGSNPVIMKRGDPVFMITFAKLDHPAPAKTTPTIESIRSIRSDWIAGVRGPPVSLVKLSRRVERLELRFELFLAIGGTLAIVAIGALVSWLLGFKP